MLKWIGQVKVRELIKFEAENENDSCYGSFKIKEINESDLDFEVESSRIS